MLVRVGFSPKYCRAFWKSAGEGTVKKRLSVFVVVITAVVCTLSTHAQTYYVAGDFNGWDAAVNVMTQITAGVWQASLTGLSVGRHQFKITVNGTWDVNYPPYNSWLYTDPSGNVTITFNSNTVTDGWFGAFGRIGVNVDPGTWTAVGNWQSWNTTNPATAMASIGAGVYKLSTNLPPGAYEYQAVLTGSTTNWDAIGGNFRSEGAVSLLFTNATAGTVAYDLYVNAPVGIITVSNAPPACSYTLSPTSVLSPPVGGTGSITLTTASGCPWAVTSNVPWIVITSAASGTGSSSINYSVGTNTSASGRSGTVTIAYQTFTVNQYGLPLGGTVIDGTAETNVYGCLLLAAQAIGTTFGNSSTGQIDVADGSELDSAYGRIENGILYLVLGGNLASDFTKLEIFFDTSAPGGENTLTNLNPNIDAFDGSSALEIMGAGGPGGTNGTPGLTFDTGFAANYWMGVNCGGSPFTVYANYAQLYPGGGGSNGNYLGMTVVPTNGTLFGGTNTFGIQAAINNINVGGVDANACYQGPVGQELIRTGVELGIPLAALGNPTGAVKVCAFINGQNHNLVSDQALGPIWNGSGLFCAAGDLGVASSVNFANEPGDQYFVVGPEMRITGVAKSGSNINITWLTGTNSNLVYQLQRTSTLTPSSWTDIGIPTNGTGLAVTQTDSSASTNSTMFYRVQESMGGCP
jgi:Carbohydrate-binding module 48 (Isoamylase N-terminal domain)/Putative binding domain, N-terminal